eukprot:TRINITY_DN5818_c0_g1_i1.p1 TRINITY_DN5818_c0_g1~~TRINITY_DN5818_c0_g1_i1.p1  ORF type:complete len:396 (-),score=36.15 TRINITY_DN5818_c0_g1_i1:182-1369(-)
MYSILNLRVGILVTIISPFVLFFYCEYAVYYSVLYSCSWPTLDSQQGSDTTLAFLVLGDPHLIGKSGHWFDRLRREWQMERSFSSAITLFQPEFLLLLGDAFDEGASYSAPQTNAFENDFKRFNRIFNSSDIPIYVAIGNHDLGFHSDLHRKPHTLGRWEKYFGEANRMFTVKNQPFLMLNSMTFANDNCQYCNATEDRLSALTAPDPEATAEVKPILLLHFPLYRANEKECEEIDINSAFLQKMDEYRDSSLMEQEHNKPVFDHTNRPGYDTVSKDATNNILTAAKPMFVFSAHTHYFCAYRHILEDGTTVQEVTVSTFNWRNRNDPSFLLVKVDPLAAEVKYSVCRLPQERTVAYIYAAGALFWTLLFVFVTYSLLHTPFAKSYFKHKENKEL